MNKRVLRILSKAALLLVVFGFFQPVACNQNGFSLANGLMDTSRMSYKVSALGFYLTFFAAVISIVYTIVFIMTKQDICSQKAFRIDLTCVLASIAGGAIAFFCFIKDFSVDILNCGSYIILCGWLASLGLLLGSKK